MSSAALAAEAAPTVKRRRDVATSTLSVDAASGYIYIYIYIYVYVYIYVHAYGYIYIYICVRTADFQMCTSFSSVCCSFSSVEDICSDVYIVYTYIYTGLSNCASHVLVYLVVDAARGSLCSLPCVKSV